MQQETTNSKSKPKESLKSSSSKNGFSFGFASTISWIGSALSKMDILSRKSNDSKVESLNRKENGQSSSKVLQVSDIIPGPNDDSNLHVKCISQKKHLPPRTDSTHLNLFTKISRPFAHLTSVFIQGGVLKSKTRKYIGPGDIQLPIVQIFDEDESLEESFNKAFGLGWESTLPEKRKSTRRMLWHRDSSDPSNSAAVLQSIPFPLPSNLNENCDGNHNLINDNLDHQVPSISRVKSMTEESEEIKMAKENLKRFRKLLSSKSDINIRSSYSSDQQSQNDLKHPHSSTDSSFFNISSISESHQKKFQHEKSQLEPLNSSIPILITYPSPTSSIYTNNPYENESNYNGGEGEDGYSVLDYYAHRSSVATTRRSSKFSRQSVPHHSSKLITNMNTSVSNQNNLFQTRISTMSHNRSKNGLLTPPDSIYSFSRDSTPPIPTTTTPPPSSSLPSSNSMTSSSFIDNNIGKNESLPSSSILSRIAHSMLRSNSTKSKNKTITPSSTLNNLSPPPSPTTSMESSNVVPTSYPNSQSHSLSRPSTSSNRSDTSTLNSSSMGPAMESTLDRKDNLKYHEMTFTNNQVNTTTSNTNTNSNNNHNNINMNAHSTPMKLVPNKSLKKSKSRTEKKWDMVKRIGAITVKKKKSMAALFSTSPVSTTSSVAKPSSLDRPYAGRNSVYSDWSWSDHDRFGNDLESSKSLR